MEKIIAKLLQEFEQGKITRRQLIRSVALTATVGSAVRAAQVTATSPLKAVSVNHMSFDTHDYTKVRDFYTDMLKMTVWGDGVKAGQCHLLCGDTYLSLRNRPFSAPISRVEHIAIGLETYDQKVVEAALKSRGIPVQWAPDGNADIHDPEGFHVQIVAKDYRDT